jgi:hypothetical protein
MRTEHDLLRYLASGENIHTEFKRLVHSPEKIAKSMTAFANTSGGVILIGVDDDRRVVGIASEKETTEIIWEAAQFHTDPVVGFTSEVIEYRGRDVMAIRVEASESKPHFHISESRDTNTFKKTTERKVYIRDNAHNIAAHPEVVKLMVSEKRPLRLSFGDNERTLLKYLDTYHRITVQEFSRLTNLSSRRASRILITMVRAQVIDLHSDGRSSFYTLSHRAA